MAPQYTTRVAGHRGRLRPGSDGGLGAVYRQVGLGCLEPGGVGWRAKRRTGYDGTTGYEPASGLVPPTPFAKSRPSSGLSGCCPSRIHRYKISEGSTLRHNSNKTWGVEGGGDGSFLVPSYPAAGRFHPSAGVNTPSLGHGRGHEFPGPARQRDEGGSCPPPHRHFRIRQEVLSRTPPPASRNNA